MDTLKETLSFVAAIVGLLTAHLAIMWHQKHTQFRGPGRSEQNVVGVPLWPTFALAGLGVLLVEWWYFQRRPGGWPSS